MKIADQGKGPRSRREVGRRSVFYVIGQQDEDQEKNEDGLDVDPFQAEGAEYRLHSDFRGCGVRECSPPELLLSHSLYVCNRTKITLRAGLLMLEDNLWRLTFRIKAPRPLNTYQVWT